jgi:hypothetical protein
MTLRRLASWSVAAAAALSMPVANAAFVTYLLDQTNGEPSLTDSVSYAQVRIDDDTPGRITFSVSALSSLSSLAGGQFGLQQFGFNVIGVSGLSDASGSNAQWSLPLGWVAEVAPPPNQLDGFGRFDVAITGSGSNRQSPLQFQLIGTGLALSSFADASTGGAGQGNVYFAAHIAGFNGPGGVSSAFFGGSTSVPPSAVPLPNTALLLAAGLCAMFIGARRRQSLR